MSERLESPAGPGAGLRNPADLVAALIPIGIAVFAFWAAWVSNRPAAPTALLVSFGILMVANGAALMFFRQRVINIQDYYGGLALVALAVVALYASADLPGMRGFSFGPGTAPRLFGGMLGGFGVLIILLSLYIAGPGLPKYAARGPLLVTSAILLFAVSIRPLGLVISSFLMFTFAASGSKETKWVEAIIAAAVLTAFCVALFAYLLNLPFQLWPRFTLGPLRIGY